jgi:hypothetical protein
MPAENWYSTEVISVEYQYILAIGVISYLVAVVWRIPDERRHL